METTAPIIYREFWDVPRIFIARYRGKQYLFDCKFDESVDEYSGVYQVYLLPSLDESEINGSWDRLYERADEYLGEVLVSGIVFDESRRRAIDSRVIEEFAKSGRK